MRVLQQAFCLSHIWLKFTFSVALSNEPSALQGSEENAINGGTGTLSQCLRSSSDNVWKGRGNTVGEIRVSGTSMTLLAFHSSFLLAVCAQ